MQQEPQHTSMKFSKMLPWFTSIIRSGNMLVIQNAFISKRIIPQEIMETWMIHAATLRDAGLPPCMWDEAAHLYPWERARVPLWACSEASQGCLYYKTLLVNRTKISKKSLLILQNTCNPGYSPSKVPLYTFGILHSESRLLGLGFGGFLGWVRFTSAKRKCPVKLPCQMPLEQLFFFLILFLYFTFLPYTVVFLVFHPGRQRLNPLNFFLQWSKRSHS